MFSNNPEKSIQGNEKEHTKKEKNNKRKFEKSDAESDDFITLRLGNCVLVQFPTTLVLFITLVDLKKFLRSINLK